MRYLLLFTSCFLFCYTLEAQWAFSTLSETKADIAVVRIKNRLFFTGGSLASGGGSQKVEIYDGITDKWTVENFSTHSAGDLKSAVSGAWAIFGQGVHMLRGKTFAYSDNTKTWTTTDFPSTRSSYAIGILGNKAYFAGGRTVAGEPSKEVNTYNFVTGEWTTAELLSQARNNIRTVTVGQKIFFIGGAINISLSQLSSVIDVYDATTDTWSTLTLSQARQESSIAVVGNKIIIAGGQPRNNLSASLMSKKVDIIDVATNTITTVTDLSTPNYQMTNVVIGDKIIFAGGLTNKAEILDLSTGKWQTFTLTTASETLSSLKSARVGNKAFFAGGSVNDAKTVFIYDAIANTWSTYTLPVAQIDPAMMAIDNQVIIAGGRTAFISGSYTNQLSIFTDATIVGVPQVEPESSLKITPNPSGGLYNLDWLTGDQPLNARVVVYGFDGKKMLDNQLQGNQLNLTQFAPGIYHVQIYADKRVWYKTLVKQ